MSKVEQGASIKLALIFAVLLALTTPGEACHRYSHWAYPWPQKCPAADGDASTPENAYVPKKASLPKAEKRFKTSRTVVPTTASDAPSAADLDRLRAALIRKLEREPKP
jgi:hypothetical protein